MENFYFKPEWRTSTVVAIAQQMRELKDYSGLPILADAIQEAGCEDEEFLTKYRTCVSWGESACLCALALSERAAGAVAYMEEVAEHISGRERAREYYSGDDLEDALGWYGYITGSYLMEAGKRAAAEGSFCWPTDEGAEFFYSQSNTEEFWENYTLITGQVVNYESDDIYFRCAC